VALGISGLARRRRRVGDHGFEPALGQCKPQGQANHTAAADQDIDASQVITCLISMQNHVFA